VDLAEFTFMPVDVVRRGRVAGYPSSSEVTRCAVAMLVELGERAADLSVVLCDDPTIRRLNHAYRRKDRPTDVLAFALREGLPSKGADQGTLGDVVISMTTARRQAREHDHSLRREVLTLLAHGLLHLLGWDHRTDAEDQRMRARVDRLVAAVPGRSSTQRERKSNERLGRAAVRRAHAKRDPRR